MGRERPVNGWRVHEVADAVRFRVVRPMPDLPPALITKLRKLRLKGKPLDISPVEDTPRGRGPAPAAARRRPRY